MFFAIDIVITSSPIVVYEDVKFEEFEKKVRLQAFQLVEHLQYKGGVVLGAVSVRAACFR